MSLKRHCITVQFNRFYVDHVNISLQVLGLLVARRQRQILSAVPIKFLGLYGREMAWFSHRALFVEQVERCWSFFKDRCHTLPILCFVQVQKVFGFDV